MPRDIWHVYEKHHEGTEDSRYDQTLICFKKATPYLYLYGGSITETRVCLGGHTLFSGIYPMAGKTSVPRRAHARAVPKSTIALRCPYRGGGSDGSGAADASVEQEASVESDE